MKIETYLDHQSILENRRPTVFFAVRFLAPEIHTPQPPPGAYCIALDQSLSIDDHAFGVARRFIQQFIRHLPKDSLISVVAFSEQAEALFDLGTVTDKPALQAMVGDIQPADYGTNISAALLMAREQLRNAPPGVAARKILLITDGEHTAGIRDEDALVRLASDLHDEGISVTTVHLGETNQALLQKLAAHGGGHLYPFICGENIHEILLQELGALQPLAAQNVRLRMKRLDFCEGIEPLGRACSGESDGWLTFAIGDLLSGEDHTLCFNLTIPILPCIDDLPCATLANEALLEIEAGYDAIAEAGCQSKLFTETVRVSALAKNTYPPPGDGTLSLRDGS